MGKQVNFTIKLRIDGKDQFVSAATSSKALADAIGRGNVMMGLQC